MRLATSTRAFGQNISKKVVIGFVTLATAAIVGTVGMASANQNAPQATGYGDTNVDASASINVDVQGNNNIVYVVFQPVYNFIFN